MKKAYTLSEVLVVLLVLGIIAAFIIPAVMRTAPDRPALLYKKSFYSMQEAASKMINNSDMYPKGEVINGQATKGLFSDKTATVFCENLANTFNIIDDASAVGCGSAGTNGAPNFYTTNGVAWYDVGGKDFSGAVNGAAFKDIGVDCAGTPYKIRVYEDGRVGTGSDSTWEDENQILREPFKFRR